jgi:hypothetical protein
MDDKTYNTWDVIVKILGFLATALSIYIGISQFSNQQKAASDLELNKNFWTMQNTLYTEICKNAGALAANLNDPKTFEAEKTKFLTHYYGEMVLVEDDNVSKQMIALKAYLDVFRIKDPDMGVILTRKILELSNACRNSSITFKRANLK